MLREKSFTYRAGSLDDFHQLQKLGINCYKEFKNVLTDENWNKLYDGLHSDEKLTDLISKFHVFICETDDEIIGVAYLVPSGNPDGVFESNWSYIRRVGVHPLYRGHGIAKRLTELCINKAKANNEKTLALHTSEFMNAARHVYESLGFVRVKEIEPIFGKRYWLYSLNLAQ